MKGSSFRDILAEFLEEKSPISPEYQSEQKRFSPEPTPLLFWKNENLRQTPKHAYPHSPRKTAPIEEAEPARPVVIERLFKLEHLSLEAQLAVRALRSLGASDLGTDISSERVKRAHRRLAKALHPDRGGSTERFLEAQNAYEVLSEELKTLTLSGVKKEAGTFSDSACDSESASGQASQRRAAA